MRSLRRFGIVEEQEARLVSPTPVVTSALLVENWVTFNNAATFESLAAWMAACALLGLSQVGFLLIAARIKYTRVVVMASGVLVCIAAFIYMPPHMVS